MDRKSNLYLQSVIFDMDGTLLDSHKQILNSTKQAIKKLQKQGMEFGIATGRPWYFALKTWHEINSKLPIISCNGALIYDPINKQTLHVNPIKKLVAKQVLETLQKQQVNFLVYTSQKMYKYQATNQSKWFEWLDNQLANTPEQMRFELNWIDADFDIDQHDVVKFLYIVAESTQEKELETASLLKQFSDDTYLLKSQPTVLDVMPKGSDKGQGIQVLSDWKYLDLNNTIAFGDEANDAPMFGVTKYSVAMGQSNQHIKDQATFVTDDNNSDGIANFFKKYYNI